MKTLTDIINNHQSRTIDGRDITRLSRFIPPEHWPKLGLTPNPEYTGTVQTVPWTRENILQQLETDLEFAFEKALDKRGISSSLMWEVIMMWNNILEEGLENWPEDNYAQYGLPLYKATALKYNFDNPIGDDTGDEYKYSAESDYE